MRLIVLTGLLLCAVGVAAEFGRGWGAIIGGVFTAGWGLMVALYEASRKGRS